MEWIPIKTKSCIDHLFHEYYDFHDSCIYSVQYVSGAGVDKNGNMHGIDPKCSLLLRLESQMAAFYKEPEKRVLELKFTGLHRLNLIGYQNNYFSNISSCHLSFYQNYVVWSEDDSFEPENYKDHDLLKEPMSTFVVADSLEWRFL